MLSRIKNLRYILLMAVVVVIILFAGGYQLPKYVSRLISIAMLAVVDMLYWFPVRRYFKLRFKKILSIVYWLPMSMLILFFIAGLLDPYTQWPAFLRIYFSGILLILLIGKGIFLLLMIIGDCFIFPFKIIKWIRLKQTQISVRWKRPVFIVYLAAGLASFVMLAYISGMFLWVSDYKINTIEIPVKNLPEAFDGYKVAQISDLHLGSFLTDRPLNKIVRMVNDQHPDIVMFTGDLVNFSTIEAYPFENVMKKITAPDGVFAILGNHDYGEYTQWDSQKDKDMNDRALVEYYERIGWQLLRNQNEIIRRDSTSMAIIGVENWSISKRFGKKGDLKKAISGAESAQFKILLSHDPSHWDGEVTIGYPQIGLTLSGHTHAFQLAIESGSIKWSPASLLFKEWGGLYEKVHKNGEKQYLYVNRGAGTLGYPGRIATRPEITILILRNSN